ncbi:hypothetical protein [Neisseria meningitidis]|uniref:hypothetical protein n=1 Tax=Neisseria meningitidis TaxID=487 RepID=UPI00067CA393|nr:hypothetical protein [Neisseria meningitidis]
MTETGEMTKLKRVEMCRKSLKPDKDSDGILYGRIVVIKKSGKGDEAADSTNSTAGEVTPVLVFVNPLDKATKPQTVQ